MTHRVAALVIGGGISGLACAYALRKAGVDAFLVEASDRAGGAIRTQRRDGYLVELGPQSFSGTAQMLQLFDELGIRQQVVQAPGGAPRYVLVNGALLKVPMSPPAFLTSGFVGLGTKSALLRDLIGKSTPPENDESIADFVRRKFSAEMLDRLVGPFVSGVYAGDPEKLSLRSSFPLLYDAETSKGSVIRGMLSKAKKQKPDQPRHRPTLLSFAEGAQAFTDALAAKLGDRLLLNASVTSVVRDQTEPTPVFRVEIQTRTGQQSFIAANVIVATATDAAADLLREVEPTISNSLAEIEYASIAVISLGYPKNQIGDPLHGFGFLVPRSSGVRTLGTVWNTSLFPHRAPDGNALLTSFIGGATDPNAAQLPPDGLAAIVHKDIAPLLKIRGTPAFSNVTIYSRALPQYNLGHSERLAAINEARQKHSNLWLVGNYLRGPSIGACVEHSLAVAEEIIRQKRPLL
ncbi:MAG TPA: protoporphyrinogen oxidase [Candidatus Acidoferrum sp.]|nr:protoporphyrinogen oxidase [Candidatus Acidoferrum sp.]